MAVGTGAAGASTALARPVPTATGHVALANPSQYVNFIARAGHSRNHGSIDYANFTYKLPGTHVWNIGGTHPLNFTVGNDTYAHAMTVDTVTPLSTHSTLFSGTGTYVGHPDYTWTVTGKVSWNAVSFSIAYTGTDKGYTLKAHGFIARDGSVSGTATDIRGNRLTFTMDKGSAFEVLRYTAPVAWASVYRHGNATFGYTIPKWLPKDLAGLHIVVKVHDGGLVKHDTFGFGVATSRFNGPVTYYQITSGNILVRR
jgi:hypothetical protein